MTVLYFLLGIVLLVLLILLVVGPIREGVVDDSWEEDPDALPPERRREVALEELRAARFDYEAEKLPEEEYRRLRTRWGRALLRAEEELGAEEARPEPGAAAEAGRAGVAEASAGEAGAKEPKEAPGACSECGALPKPGARFCSRCGSRLPEEPAAAEGSGRKGGAGHRTPEGDDAGTGTVGEKGSGSDAGGAA